MTTMTKKELLVAAKTLNIIGRHDMTKEALQAAVEAATPAKKVKKSRKRSTAERDANGNVIREGRNLSGNIPFSKKYYFLNMETIDTKENQLRVESAPNQVKLIVRWMLENDVTEPENAMRGIHIVDGAKDDNVLVSKIGSAELFAYYRRVLETVGLEEA